MTRLSLLFFVGLFANAVLAETLAMALMRDGAIATIQLHVVDEQGRPIEDVEAHLGFWKPASALFASNRDSGTTDEEGNVQLSARCFTDGDYIWPRMRRWSSTVGGGFICREAGCIQERRVDDETDDLHGDGDVGGGDGICMVMAMLAAGMAMGATRLVPRLLVLESASVGEKTWIYRTLEQGSIVKGDPRGDYPEGGTA